MAGGIILLARGSQIKAIQNLPNIRFLFLPLLPMPTQKRKYNAVSIVADEVWQYHTGRNLTIFNKDRDTIETAEVLAAKHRRSLRLPCTASGN